MVERIRMIRMEAIVTMMLLLFTNSLTKTTMAFSVGAPVSRIIARKETSSRRSITISTYGRINKEPPKSRSVVLNMSSPSSDATANKKEESNSNDPSAATRSIVSSARGTMFRLYREKFVKNLPPQPDDQLAIIGDVSSLFLYGIIDNLVSVAYVQNVLDQSDSVELAAKALDPNGLLVNPGSVPVWMDVSTTSTSVIESTTRLAMHDQLLPQYAPLLSTAGTACVSLAVCWLFAGYLTQAFSFQNTLDCTTHRVVKVVGKTWILSSSLMLLLAFGSRFAECGCGHITVSDIDYISNSFGVLLTWRMMVSYLIGNWSDENN